MGALISDVAKRLFDVLASIAGLLILLPLFFIIAIGIRVTSPGPALFRQRRVGRFGYHFNVLKFRTMVDGAEVLARETGGLSDPRITNFGRFLRRTKLDELPQLVNVLVGDMSFVGPRPEIPYYADNYSPDDKVVLTVRPGITDPCSLEMADLDAIMQTRGSRSPGEFYLAEIQPRKLELQKKYIQDHTFCGDILIIIRTVFRIVRS